MSPRSHPASPYLTRRDAFPTSYNAGGAYMKVMGWQTDAVVVNRRARYLEGLHQPQRMRGSFSHQIPPPEISEIPTKKAGCHARPAPPTRPTRE